MKEKSYLLTTLYITARPSGGRSFVKLRRAAQCSAGGHARAATKLAAQKPRRAEKAPVGASVPGDGGRESSGRWWGYSVGWEGGEKSQQPG